MNHTISHANYADFNLKCRELGIADGFHGHALHLYQPMGTALAGMDKDAGLAAEALLESLKEGTR